MKKNYIIQYDIDDDEILKDRIKELWPWINYFPKSFIVSSDSEKAKEIYDKISTGYDKNRILIIELVKDNYWGVMPTKAWEWLKERKNTMSTTPKSLKKP